MAQRRRTSGVAQTALFSAALLAGCTAQDEPVAEDPPPTSSTTEPSPLGDPVTGTYTGTHTIEVGAPPPDATHIYVDITCLSAGTLVMPDGFEVTCLDPDNGNTRTYSSIPLSPEQDSFEIATNDPDVTYAVKAVYENGAFVR